MKKRTIRQYVTVILVIGLLFIPQTLYAIEYIDLKNPFLRKIPMAVPEFKPLANDSLTRGQTMAFANELQEMLDFSGYFKMLERTGFLHDARASGITKETINFQNWTSLGAELLITGAFKVEGGKLYVELRLFDTFKSDRLIGLQYEAKATDRRKILQRFCTEVLKKLTGGEGFYHSRMAFVSKGTGHKEIYQCDFDGRNIRQITKYRSITSFPAWSSTGEYLAYTSYVHGPVQIIIHNLKTGSKSRVRYKGVQIAPSWVPNKLELAATLSHNRDQEIYLLTRKGKMIKRLTNSRGIDVETSWSPDGKKFAFVSKRSGTPQIYIKEVDTGRVYRLTFEGQYNTQPSWSPKGKKIAYTSMADGEINVFTIDVEGTNPVQLTYNQGDNEAPTWSPDGSLIAFSSTREGRSRIYVMTAFGTDQRRLFSLAGEQFHPVWSPNIK